MPYKSSDRGKVAQDGRKVDPRSRRVNQPEIFVAVGERESWRRHYVKAHLRIRRGCYRYLVWREAGRIREFYLGKVRETCPTRAPGPRRRQPGARATGRARRVGYKKD